MLLTALSLKELLSLLKMIENNRHLVQAITVEASNQLERGPLTDTNVSQVEFCLLRTEWQ